MAQMRELQIVDVLEHEGKLIQVKPIDLEKDETIQYMKVLTRLSPHSKYFAVPGLFIITDRKVVFTPKGVATKIPGRVWTTPLDNVENVYQKRRPFTKEDFIIGLGLDTATRILMLPYYRALKPICIELADGKKQYFTLQDIVNTDLDAFNSKEVANAAIELRQAIVDARVSTLKATQDIRSRPQQEPSQPDELPTTASDPSSVAPSSSNRTFGWELAGKTEEFKQKIIAEHREGWQIKRDGDHEVLMYKPTFGTLKWHVIIAILTIWWTWGLGNLTYALYKYYLSPPIKILRDDLEIIGNDTVQPASLPSARGFSESNGASTPTDLDQDEQQVFPSVEQPGVAPEETVSVTNVDPEAVNTETMLSENVPVASTTEAERMFSQVAGENEKNPLSSDRDHDYLADAVPAGALALYTLLREQDIAIVTKTEAHQLSQDNGNPLLNVARGTISSWMNALAEAGALQPGIYRANEGREFYVI